jgi:outer membrane protein assembly complex protein YaeT
LLVVVCVVAGLLYLRSGGLNRLITAQVQSALAEYGLRTEIGGFELSLGARTANIRDIKIYNQQTGQQIATVDRAELVVEVPSPFALRLRREVIFKRLDFENLRMYVDLDEHGQSNFTGLHSPPPSAPSSITFDFSALVGSITGGELHISDLQHKLAVGLGNLQAKGEPITGGTLVGIQFEAGPGVVSYEGRETQIDGIDFSTRLSESGAELEKLNVHSKVTESDISGRIDDFNALRYKLDLKTRVVLDEATRVFAPDFKLQGSASVEGHMEGEAEKFKLTGRVKSDGLTASGDRARGISIDDIEVASDGNRINFETKRARANDISVQGTELTSVEAVGLRGVLNDGRTQASLQQVKVNSVSLSQVSLNAISLQSVTGTLQGGRYEVGGALSIERGTVRGSSVGQTKGQLLVNNTSVALNGFTSSLLGGSAKGDVAVALAGNGASHLKASLSQLKTDEVFKLVSADGTPPLTGSADAQADVTWPGTNFSSLSGNVTAHLTAQTTQTANAIPVTGDVSIKATGGTFNIDQAVLATDASRVTASGRFAAKGDSDLTVSLTSTNADELQTIAYSIDDVKKSLEDVQPHLSGNFSFQGHLTGPLDDPALQGDVKADSIGLRDQVLGSLAGHVAFSPTDVAFQNGVLSAPNGGSAKFTYAAPRSAIATEGRLDATVDRLSLDSLLAAAGVKAQPDLASGDLSGEAHLTGLPGSPTGAASVNLLNGKVFGQQAQTAAANLVFDGKTATLNRAELKLAQGQLTATGNLDLKTDAFHLEGNAQNIDLAQLADSLGASNITVTGVANATFKADGNTGDIEKLNVQLNAQGQNVTVNGHSAGELSLTAATNPEGRVDVNLTTGLAGTPQSLKASVELRQPGRPIQASSDFTNLDFSPLLTIFAPDVAASISGSLTGRLRVSGPSVNDKNEFTMDGLRGGLTLDAITLQYQKRPVTIQTPLTVALNGPEVTLNQTHITGQGFDISLGGTLGLSDRAGLGFFIAGTSNLDALDLLGSDLFLGGTATINARLEGTVDNPQLNGDLRLANISLSGPDLPVAIDNGNGRVVFAGESITIETFTAQANDGNITANGALALDHLHPKDWRFGLNAANVDVVYQGAHITMNGDLSLVGTPDRQVLSGSITIPDGEYTTNLDIATLTGSGSSSGGLSVGGESTGGVAGPFGLPLNLDLHVEAPNTLLIRNQQVNTVGTASLSIGGTLDNPSVTGRVALEGGTIKFRAERLDIDTGTLDFPGGGANPEVNIMTEGDIGGYHVYIGLEGPIDNMEVTLRSDPELQRSDILSLVATGKVGSNTLGSQELMASGLGTAGSLLSESFISQPAQSLLGLNRFAIDPVIQPNANPAARLTVGKQLTRDLGFTYSTNVGSEQDQSIIVEYTLSNRYSGIASYNQGGAVISGARTDTSFSIEMRARRRFALGYGGVVAAGAAPVAHSPKAPPRAAKPALPKAEVSLENPAGVKLSSKTLRQLLPVETEGFSKSLARLGERNLTTYLQEHGYFFAEVQHKCEPADCSGSDIHVTYDLQPGQRYDLDAIRIEGAEGVPLGDVTGDLQSKKATVFGAIPIVRGLPLIGGYARGITSDDRIRHDRDTIRAKLGDLGYRAARVEWRTATKPDSPDIVLIFQVDPGPRSTVAAVSFRGNGIFSREDLRSVVPIKNGDFFSPTQARDGAKAIKARYGDNGYLEATAAYTVVDLAPDRVRLVYDVTEGSRAVVSDVAITGESRTHENSIRRFLAFKPGDILTPSAIRRTSRELYSTGAFSEVNIRNEQASPDDPNSRKVTVRVEETKPLLWVYGLGYSSDEGPRGLSQLTDTNFLGRANSASIRLRMSANEQLAQLQYTDLRPFGGTWSLTVSAFYDRNSNLRTFVQRNLVGGGTSSVTGPGFGIDRFVAFAQTEHKFSDHTSVRFRYSFEKTNLFNLQNVPVEQIPPSQQAIHLGLLSAGITWDTRDSALNASKGQLVSLDYTLAERFLGGAAAFNKLFANYQRYKLLDASTPVLKDSVLAFSARVGLSAPFAVRPSGPNGTLTDADFELPIAERFFSGGATTLRGYRFDQAGPQAILEPRNAQELPTLVPIGGDALIILNFEERYPLTRQLRLVPFYDLGNVFARVSNISLRGLSHTVGMGIRLNTPLGPVGFDYGYLLNPPSFLSTTGIILRQPHGVFHIRFGQTF